MRQIWTFCQTCSLQSQQIYLFADWDHWIFDSACQFLLSAMKQVSQKPRTQLNLLCISLALMNSYTALFRGSSIVFLVSMEGAHPKTDGFPAKTYPQFWTAPKKDPFNDQLSSTKTYQPVQPITCTSVVSEHICSNM